MNEREQIMFQLIQITLNIINTQVPNLGLEPNDLLNLQNMVQTLQTSLEN